MTVTVTDPHASTRDDAPTHRGGWTWRLRRGFWNRLTVFKYEHQKPTPIAEPTRPDPSFSMVPLNSVYPSIPITRLAVAATVPDDEAAPLKQRFTKVQGFIDSRWPLTRPGLPEIPADAEAALDRAFTTRHRRCYPAPERTTADLGELAVASPYASYLEARDDGTFAWDLSVLTEFDAQQGLVRLGATVIFERDPDARRVHPVRIDSAAGSSTPDSPDWESATRLAMCSITTHASLVRHFNFLHLTSGAPLEAATRRRLAARHPVRRLLWPHVFGTHASNDFVTEIQMKPGGDFESIFGLTQHGFCELFEATAADFDLAMINPVTDAARRGIDTLDCPAHDNRTALYQAMLAHTSRYLDLYYASDDDVANDQALGEWLADVDSSIANGIRGVCGGSIGLDALATLTATIIYLATVEHEITGTGLWDYQLWPDVSPVRIYEDGRRLPVDVYQHSVNANLNLNSHRLMLLDDRIPMIAGDAHGEDAMRRFQQDLLALQSELDRSPAAPWRLEPRLLKANINA
ncbi:lipoxygenase family protein [Ilumatobacter sp.]|uniref:lipoxygenase family protein n=1 Tax=Ilumatobacter sp. TaxID=1967498 RepID=UPI003C5775C5